MVEPSDSNAPSSETSYQQLSNSQIASPVFQATDLHQVLDMGESERSAVGSVRKQRHILTRSQTIQSVYAYLDQLEAIHLQLLDRRHYEQLIPMMFYSMSSQVGSRLICWQFEQIVCYDLLTRQQHFFCHDWLER